MVDDMKKHDDSLEDEKNNGEEQLLEKERQSEEHYENLFQLYSQMFFSGNVPLLLEIYNALNQDSYNHAAYFFGGMALVSMKEYWNSMALFRSACDLDPKNFIYAKAASIVSDYIGNEADHAFYEKMCLASVEVTQSPILDFLEERLGNDQSFIKLIGEGNKAYSEEKFTLALQKYSEAVGQRFVNLVALRRVIDVLMILGRPHEALGFARGIMEVDDKRPEDFVLIADILARTGEFSVAEDYYKHAHDILLDVSLSKVHSLRSFYNNPSCTYETVVSEEKKISQDLRNFFQKQYSTLNLDDVVSKKVSSEGKCKIGFISRRFSLGMGIDSLLNFIPSLSSSECSIVCFNSGLKQENIKSYYRSYDIDVVELENNTKSDVKKIRDYNLDIVVDLDGFAYAGFTDIFFYSLAPVALRYYGTEASLDGGVTYLLGGSDDSYKKKGEKKSYITMDWYAFSKKIDNPLSVKIIKNKKTTGKKGLLVGLAIYEYELSSTILKKIKVILDGHKENKVVLFAQKFGGYLSLLKWDEKIQAMGLSGRVLVSTLTEGATLSYGEFINEIDMLVDLSVGNASDESYYALLADKPVLTVRGNLPHRGEVADMLLSLGLGDCVFNKDDDLIDAMSMINSKDDSYKDYVSRVQLAISEKEKKLDNQVESVQKEFLKISSKG